MFELWRVGINLHTFAHIDLPQGELRKTSQTLAPQTAQTPDRMGRAQYIPTTVETLGELPFSCV